MLNKFDLRKSLLSAVLVEPNVGSLRLLQTPLTVLKGEFRIAFVQVAVSLSSIQTAN